MIELHFWQQLAAIAECGTISAAAEKLHVTQPALSRSMKRMEELLDVRLFHRGKNKIELSDAGRLAAEYAVRLLENEADIVEKLRLFERARHTIQVGSCAPVPLRELVPRLTDRYPDKAVTAEVREEAVLMRQFAEGTMQIIVLTHPLEQEGIFCKKLLEEKMFFCVPESHPLAKKEGVTWQEINQETVLFYSNTGFWHDLCLAHLPNARLLLQTDFDVYLELAKASKLPFFVSSWHLEHTMRPQQRVCLPIAGGDAEAAYYGICRWEERGFLR